MAIVIRLTKVGRKGEARFRIVVAEKRSRRDGKPIETLGWLEKSITGIKKKINKKRYDYWFSCGAKPTPTVLNLIKGTDKT